MTLHNNFILPLCVALEKGVRIHGRQRKANHGHTNQILFLIEGKREKLPPKKKTTTGDSQKKSASFTWSDEG